MQVQILSIVIPTTAGCVGSPIEIGKNQIQNSRLDFDPGKVTVEMKFKVNLTPTQIVNLHCLIQRQVAYINCISTLSAVGDSTSQTLPTTLSYDGVDFIVTVLVGDKGGFK